MSSQQRKVRKVTPDRSSTSRLGGDDGEDTEGLRTVEGSRADYGQGEHGDIDEENGLSLASDSFTSDESSLKEDIRASGAL